MSVEQNPIILSFYQAALIPMLRAVQMAWMNKDYNGAFNNLKLIYTWLPNKCKKECQAEYDNAIATIDAIGKAFKELDISTRRTKIGIATRNYLYEAVLHLSATFHDSLDRNKYLEKTGVKPKFEKMAEL
jgi:hypothetical protein